MYCDFNKYSESEIAEFINYSFKTAHHISEREYYENIKTLYYDVLIKAEKKVDDMEYPVLKASLYMEFSKNGNRDNFQKEYFKRRNALVIYTILEAIDNDGKRMEKIIDFLWMILEERTWCLPAHVYLIPGADALGSVDTAAIDLFAAETACTISYVQTILKDRFDDVSLNINKLVDRVLNERIFNDYLEKDDYWWMGFKGDKVNNWNPWINSNVLSACANSCSDSKKKAAIIKKAANSLENYYNCMPFDGACDEGVGYWFYAGLAMLESFWCLSEMTNGKFYMFNDEKTVNVAFYIVNAYIGKDRTVNFSDCSNVQYIQACSIYKFGKILNNEELCGFARFAYDSFKRTIPENLYEKVIRITDIFDYTTQIENESLKYIPKENVYLESVNFAVMRESDIHGLFLGAKGGHNGESHNHNDVGNFIVFKSLTPFVIDSGNMVYTKDTFSEKRYNIWTNSSQFHNLPMIGGCNQLPGQQYNCSDLSYKVLEHSTVFSLNIKNAYENRDDIHKWKRTFTLDRKKHLIKIEEDFEFKSEMDFSLNFLFAVKPEVSSDGIILRNNKDTLIINIDTNDFDNEIFLIHTGEDNNLRRSWGDNIYRLVLSSRTKKLNGKINYEIR